jgi:hypothetical protein
VLLLVNPIGVKPDDAEATNVIGFARLGTFAWFIVMVCARPVTVMVTVCVGLAVPAPLIKLSVKVFVAVIAVGVPKSMQSSESKVTPAGRVSPVSVQ